MMASGSLLYGVLVGWRSDIATSIPGNHHNVGAGLAANSDARDENAFERRNRLTELVQILRRQHQAGRSLTDVILRNATTNRFHQSDARQEIIHSCELFIRMYRPHETREDTVLFPELRNIISAREVRELGEQFEKEEDRLFGEGGFQNTVGQVAEIERQLGIEDLSQFTPHV